MKKRFKNNNIGIEACSSDSVNVPTSELKARFKKEIAYSKARLKKLKVYMNTFKDIANDYDYNQNHLAELIGNVYVQTDRVKGDIERTKARLKSLKKKDK